MENDLDLKVMVALRFIGLIEDILMWNDVYVTCTVK